MAIFVAFVFQVLFVFFAMLINVGLVVHDKIVLQNATDLAAYYGAQRQAELLNEVAHINYQIHQSYKLMAFRYWVIGSLPLPAHPFQTVVAKANGTNLVPYTGGALSTYQNVELPIADEKWEPRPNKDQSQVQMPWKPWPRNDPNVSYSPVVCVDHPYWNEWRTDPNNPNPPSSQSSICATDLEKLSENLNNIKNLIQPLVQNGTLNGFKFEDTYNQFFDQCRDLALDNYKIAATYVAINKLDTYVRRQMISSLEKNITDDPSSFKDINGGVVNGAPESGLRKTIEKNLPAGTNVISVEFLNSFGLDGCKTVNDGKVVGVFSPIPIVRNIPYGDTDLSSAGAQSCKLESQDIVAKPRNFQNIDNDAKLRPLWEATQISGSPSDPGFGVYGYEKNPWCMGYVGVKVTVNTKKAFMPFSKGTTMVALAFAKPFGGKIGPWYGDSWPRSALQSDGQKTDPMAPNRYKENDPQADKFLSPANYSRYPGDIYGLSSKLALVSPFQMLGSFKKKWISHFTDFDEYIKEGDQLVKPDGTSDVNGKAMRDLEIAAVAPNLFDLVHYSIEPDFFNNYLVPAVKGGLFPPGSSGLKPIGDIGGKFAFNGGGEADTDSNFMSVGAQFRSNGPTSNQINILKAYNTKGAKYFATQLASLLTFWSPAGVGDYSPDFAQFATCNAMAESPSYPTFGSCPVGGRTGFSVKLVSLDYLLSDKHQLGGVGGGQGAILNPVPEDFYK